jgi:SAM-dependent methyltransferase
MPDSEVYGPEFFEAHVEGSLRSARVVAPIVCELLWPSSVVDVGCGCGTWLAALTECGVRRVLGLDGDYVRRSSLLVSPDCFRAANLEEPISLDEKFDLALCLEVAEHLPSAAAPILVDSLANLSPVILFSAAVPLQRGTNHINEQWPQYWAELFRRIGYKRIDAIRPQIWTDTRVEWWYRQNIFLFVREDQISSYPALAKAAGAADDLMLVHAAVLNEHVWLRPILRRLPARVFSAAAGRLRWRNGRSRHD